MAIKPKDLAKALSQLTPKEIAKALSPKQKAALGLGATGTAGAGAIAKDALEELGETVTNNVNTGLNAMTEALGVQVPKSLGDLAGQIFKLRIGLDDLSKDVGRATGLFTKLGGQLEEVAERNRDLGVTFERTSKAMMGLDQGFSLLASSTKRQREETLRFTFALENLGVAAEDSGRGLEVFARGTAMSQEAARKSTERLIQLGRQIAYKGGPAQMMKDIAEIGPMIAKFGSSTEQVMGDLAKEARKTGLSMREIFDVSDQFDTYEDAMTNAGKLNAQFGLGLSSNTLMMADDAQRRQIIVDSFRSTIGTFEDLGDRRQKQAMAESLGFGKNIEKARKYLSGETLPSEQVGSLMGAALEQTKVSEVGAAAQEKTLTAMGDVELKGMGLEFGKVNEMADGLANTFSDLNSAAKVYGQLTAVEVGLDLMEGPLSALSRALGNRINFNALAKGATTATVLANAGKAGGPFGMPGQAGSPAGTGGMPGGSPGPGGDTPMGLLPAAGVGAAGVGAVGIAERLVRGSMANRAATEAGKKLMAEAAEAAANPANSRWMQAFDDIANAGTKGASGVADDAAAAVTKGAASTGKGFLKTAGKGLGVVLSGGFAFMEAQESIAAGKDPTEAYAREGLGAIGAIGGGAALGALVGGPAAPLTAFVGAVAGGILGEKAIESAFDYFMGDDKERGAATVRSKTQSADQALRRQQDSQRQTVASATTAATPVKHTTNVFINDELRGQTTNAFSLHTSRIAKTVPVNVRNEEIG